MSDSKTILLAAGKTCHACCIEVDGLGVLIIGPSGSGKTSLAHGLIENFSGRQKPAVWISDDQVYLTKADSRILAVTPQAIAGKAEIFGLGIIDVPFKRETHLDLVVEIVDDDEIERMPEETFLAFVEEEAGQQHWLDQISIRLVHVPRRHEAQSVRLVMAALAQLAEQAAKSV